MKSFRDDIFGYVREKYGVAPEYLWQRYPKHAVLRHHENRKWFSLIFPMRRKFLGMLMEDINQYAYLDLINVKCQPANVQVLLQNYGFFPAFHMNKKHWITILCNGCVPLIDILKLIDNSFNLTSKI